MAADVPALPAEVSETAPAKVNLTLHVTGRRPDGYHLLDSLVVFAGPEAADRVTARPATAPTLRVEGPRAEGVPEGPENLVLRAAALMAPAALTLWKALPAASGIGGGSADAAATIRALARLTGRALPPPAEVLRLGADVPVCLAGRAARMAGIGERLTPAEGVPPLPAVLVNPGVSVSTPAVFAALERRDGAPMPGTLPRLADAAAAARWLASQRNDLEPAALRLAPPVTEALARLCGSGALLARMSGSGATCFGLYGDASAAASAAARLRSERPDWWVVATVLA